MFGIRMGGPSPFCLYFPLFSNAAFIPVLLHTATYIHTITITVLSLVGLCEASQLVLAAGLGTYDGRKCFKGSEYYYYYIFSSLPPYECTRHASCWLVWILLLERS
ncbi:hypothetical protein F4820DRAFT_355882 [Hypoxylon rubiginosum]|uniref:Uncharacterized protein n=1 Tax=Hypoxylon rubiginosum TaxID=110542 RepID=A0ACB9YXV3_9PEZI|nr:hypothetical protein F4820DRAFT_355882 [Hypoxylon rubiginosum]